VSAGPAMVIDVDAIDQLGHSLGLVGAEFTDAAATSTRIADAVGCAVLEDAVRDFADAWDDTRAKMTQTVATLSDAATQLAQAWQQLDRDGAAALSGDSA